ncbi:recombinase family protein [Bifidobacterium pseudolongum]|uniref:recombinase family protein n=1 Tax=Bifidobacterium pseudolongum TaxID=1694 RepID=UPI002FB623D8
MARKSPKTPDAAHPLYCVLYIRVSTKLQVEKGESIDARHFELTKYAENHDMRVLGEYVDAGFSGKNVQGRPQFRVIDRWHPNGKTCGRCGTVKAKPSPSGRDCPLRQARTVHRP